MLTSRGNEKMRCPPLFCFVDGAGEWALWFVTRCLVLYGFDEQLAQQEIAKVHFLSICCIMELKHESQDAWKSSLFWDDKIDIFSVTILVFQAQLSPRAKLRGNHFFLASFLICSKPIREWCRQLFLLVVFVSSADSSSDSQDQLSSMHLASGLVIPAAVLCWQQPDFGFVLTGQTVVNHLPCTVLWCWSCAVSCFVGIKLALGSFVLSPSWVMEVQITARQPRKCPVTMLCLSGVWDCCSCSGAVSEEGCQHRNADINCWRALLFTYLFHPLFWLF